MKPLVYLMPLLQSKNICSRPLCIIGQVFPLHETGGSCTDELDAKKGRHEEVTSHRLVVSVFFFVRTQTNNIHQSKFLTGGSSLNVKFMTNSSWIHVSFPVTSTFPSIFPWLSRFHVRFFTAIYPGRNLHEAY